MQQHRDRRVADHVSTSETYKLIHIITAIAHDSTRKRSAQHSNHICGIMIESMIAKSIHEWFVVAQVSHKHKSNKVEIPWQIPVRVRFFLLINL